LKVDSWLTLNSSELAVRFLAKAEKRPDGCWRWTGTFRGSYGQFWYAGRMRQAHRISYLLFVGPVAKRKHVHHECGNEWCVNPEHLRVCAPKAHVALHPNYNSMKQACRNGHPYTSENTIVVVRRNGREFRLCRECSNESTRRWRANAR
jgi:hypothetical protein